MSHSKVQQFKKDSHSKSVLIGEIYVCEQALERLTKNLGDHDKTKSYLGCSIINFAMNLDVQNKTITKTVLLMDSEVFTTVFTNFANNVKARKVSFNSNPDFFKPNTILLIPFIKNQHWYLAEVNNDEKVITLYDSANSCSSKKHEIILGIIENIVVENWKFSVPISNQHSPWSKRSATCEQQKNGYDCGMFVIAYTAMICSGRLAIYPLDIETDDVEVKTGCRHRLEKKIRTAMIYSGRFAIDPLDIQTDDDGLKTGY